ncbi:MAG: hypothetical protein EBR82_18005 [Caulobacteraceae bacterium]|nr:hypothetical protein [Caulobacteraceae bacterium]
MPTPTAYQSASGGGGSSTTAATFTGTSYTPLAGQPMVAVVFSVTDPSLSTTITPPSGWSLISRSDVFVQSTPSQRNLCSAFYERTASGTSADDFGPTVGAGFYSGSRNWTCFSFVFADVVGANSAAYVTDTAAESNTGTFTPSTITPNRGTSLGFIIAVTRATALSVNTANGWSTATNSLAVTGQNQSGGTSTKALGAGATSMPVFNRSSAMVSLSFAVSGIPDDAADWGVDQIKW